MEYLCPLCNSLEEITLVCKKCGGIMRNVGAIQDFFDDYSPYLDVDITRKVDGVSGDQCLHLFCCSVCGSERRISINLVEF